MRAASNPARGGLSAPALAAPPAEPFTAREVTLYLHPSGARYVALERLELG